MKNDKSFPVQYSTLSSCALQEKILIKYPLNGLILCEYLFRGLNDNYLVEDSTSKYIFKVYRYNWRNMEEIEAEIELLQYLKANGVSVSIPVPDRDNNLIQKIYAPEGVRYAVLFSYAKGESPLARITSEQSHITGRELAKIHSLTINKRLKNRECYLDIRSLLDKSFLSIEPFIDDRHDDLKNLNEIINNLKLKFESISLNDLDFGICHGDFHPANYHISDSNEITIYDFDSCCCCYFVYDIASFYFSIIRFYKDTEIIMKDFLEGYQEIRGLNKSEISLIPYFGAVSFIWMVATQCSNFEIFSHFVRNNIKRNTVVNLKKFIDDHCN